MIVLNSQVYTYIHMLCIEIRSARMHELAPDIGRSQSAENARPRGAPGRLNDEVFSLSRAGARTSPHRATLSRWSDPLDRPGPLFADDESGRDG